MGPIGTSGEPHLCLHGPKIGTMCRDILGTYTIIEPSYICVCLALTLRTLTHWGRVTHICVGKTTIIGSDNGLSPGRRQAIIWTNAGILLIGTLGTNFSEILIECHSFSFKKMHMKISSGKWRPSCSGLNVLRLKQNGQHFVGDSFRHIFFLWKYW